MTEIKKTDRSSQIENVKWAPQGLRQGEPAGSQVRPASTADADQELVYPSISPRLVWPRVFPGI